MADQSWRDQYHEEDERWEPAHQRRDWLLLLVAILAVTAVYLTVFFLEPGFR